MTDAVDVTVDEKPEEGFALTGAPINAATGIGKTATDITPLLPFYKNWKIMVPSIVLIVIILILIIMVMKKKPKPLQVAQWGRRY
tara:strand:+ start:166 stop:420 length:255 start_codon:yes stop_codon:yes gene_type:complete